MTPHRCQPNVTARDFSRAGVMLRASGLPLSLSLLLAPAAFGLDGLRLISP
ncbi:hypothetical protein [Niveispirillum irakense]|uniref:hypothetical protein n=1 Tax=Niveispirillum irakense TaxID=34011 RepID=UPI0004091C01|nr:hypothetical protein [Niveispirillum irakense]